MSETVDIRRVSVKFTDSDGFGCDSLETEAAQEKKRNLTMKYGQKQRQIVQKRLKVEDWIDSELQRLYEIESPNETYPCDPDLDELLELKSEEERRQTILALLKSCKQDQSVIQAFVDELMERMKTLM